MSLDQKLESLEQNIIIMSEKVINQHNLCLEILSKQDKDKALAILKTDALINYLEEEINNQASVLVALQSPVASDLRRVVVSIKIASELERIGDYAKGLASFILKEPNIEDYNIVHYAIKMEEKAIEMLMRTMEIYTNKDINMLFEIVKIESDINNTMDLFKLELENEKDLSLKQVFYLSGLFRNIERSKDHTINICEHIIYLVKGIHYDFS